MNRQDQVIPIILACDNNYKIQLMVTILSIVRSRHPSTVYKFYILVPNEFDKMAQTAIREMLKKYQTEEPVYINMGNKYTSVEMQITHITVPTFYRLSIPDLLPIKKCIYLDTDILVCKDLRGLFDINLEEKFIAGVKAAAYYWPPQYLEKRAEKLMIPRFDSYVNAGVLVMNLEHMREENLVEQFKDRLKYNWGGQDQDILNSACYGKIEIIPPKYNSMTKYYNSDVSHYEDEQFLGLTKCFTKEEWEEACNNPVIIHYADKKKPWLGMGTDFSNLWWEALLEVDNYFPCKEELLELLTQQELIERDTVKFKISDLKQEIHQKNEYIQNGQREQAALKEELLKLQDIIRQQKEQIRYERDQNDKIKGENNRLQDELSQKHEQIKLMEERRNFVEKELLAEKKKVSVYKKKIKKLRKRLQNIIGSRSYKFACMISRPFAVLRKLIKK